jgi:uncharacterized damage-inducible protein DinB
MPGEAAQIAAVLDRIGRGVVESLTGVPPAALNQQIALPEANSLFALATHLVGAGEFWVLTLAGGRDVDRDRAAEFAASGNFEQIAARYGRWLTAVHEALPSLPSEYLDRIAEPPAAYRMRGGAPMTVRECLLHAVEHSALHQGQIEITRQLLMSGKG